MRLKSEFVGVESRTNRAWRLLAWCQKKGSECVGDSCACRGKGGGSGIDSGRPLNIGSISKKNGSTNRDFLLIQSLLFIFIGLIDDSLFFFFFIS